MKPSSGAKAVGLLRRAWRDEQGSNLVESALSSALFFVVLFGIVEFCWLFYAYHYVAFASREGSRYSIVRGSESCSNTPQLPNCNATADEIGTYVKDLGYGGINPNDVTVTVDTLVANNTSGTTTWSSCGGMSCNAPGNQVQVTVSYAFPLSIPLWKEGTFNISSTSKMVIAQ
jgi:Flp pilus assembly protein TadG